MIGKDSFSIFYYYSFFLDIVNFCNLKGMFCKVEDIFF